MNIEDKIKYQYMKILYEKLELNKIDEYFKMNNIVPKKIIQNSIPIISEYFFLFNKINLTKLTSEELNKINKYFTCDLCELDKQNNINEVNAFLVQNMFKILINSNGKKYIGYGSINPRNIVPSDAITFVCHFMRYSNNDAQNITKIVYDKLNYIQDVLSKEKNIKLAIIPCDEITGI